MLRWSQVNGRSFPWRTVRQPYQILVAEILLQRTRADLVAPIYQRFIAAYPDAHSLASADLAAVRGALRPLGFAHRAERLPKLGFELVKRHNGSVPRSRHALLRLPGVGEYIANAVLTSAFGRRVPLVDPNVIRVLDRVFGQRSDRSRPRGDPSLWSFAQGLLPSSRSGEFSLALVDLGSVVCRLRRPHCLDCPLRSHCRAFGSGAVNPAPIGRQNPAVAH